jgi:hypothetical protein
MVNPLYETDVHEVHEITTKLWNALNFIICIYTCILRIVLHTAKRENCLSPQNNCWTDSQRRPGNVTETRNKQLQGDTPKGGGV